MYFLFICITIFLWIHPLLAETTVTAKPLNPKKYTRYIKKISALKEINNEMPKPDERLSKAYEHDGLVIEWNLNHEIYDTTIQSPQEQVRESQEYHDPSLVSLPPAPLIQYQMKALQLKQKELGEKDLTDLAGASWRCVKGQKIKKGDKSPVIPNIKVQLVFWGDLQEEMIDDGDEFDENIEEAVKFFQKRHFMHPDGIIGVETCKLLNQSPEVVITKIKNNLKRLEKLTLPSNQRKVIINIPTYQLFAVSEHLVEHQQNVIVGKKQHKTPLIVTNMTSVTLNPAWGVPMSIFLRDKLRRVKDDPSYLIRGKYAVYDEDGKTVDAHSVPWQYISKSYFPYTIRQSPGKHNALGALKFNLDNKDAIYMHDTSQPNLFEKVSRALSSGCIRLSDPIDLASWALQGTPLENGDVIEDEIESKATKTVSLINPIPVQFIYITCWVDRDGTLLVSDDPYGFDNPKSAF